MNYHIPQKKNSALTTIVVCALVFFAFSFLWLYFFQGDVIAVAQHQLSGGKTHYNRFLGAVIITLVLFILQQGMFALTRLSRHAHAQTYFPSMLALGVLSSVGPEFVKTHSLGDWLWAVPLLLVLWGGGIWLSRKMEQLVNDNHQPTGLFSQCMWVNLLQLLVMMLFVAFVSNSNAVYHYRAHAEAALIDGDVDEALRVGGRSIETDANLTMLRLYALSQKGAVGDSLFTYAIKGRSADMLPLKGSSSSLLMLPDRHLWKHFGGRWPLSTMTTERFLDSLAVDTTATRAYVDYRLAGQLMDGRLEEFVATLPKYYALDADSLPRHYREALVLYQDLKGASAVVLPQKQKDTEIPNKKKPVVERVHIYQDSIMTMRLQELRSIEKLSTNRKTVQLEAEDEFRQTYWYYYLFKR